MKNSDMNDAGTQNLWRMEKERYCISLKPSFAQVYYIK